MNVSVKIKETRYDSLIVIYQVVVTGLTALPEYKNLYDSIELIRKQSEIVIKRLKHRFGDFNTIISVVHPRLPYPYNQPKTQRKYLITLSIVAAILLSFGSMILLRRSGYLPICSVENDNLLCCALLPSFQFTFF